MTIHLDFEIRFEPINSGGSLELLKKETQVQPSARIKPRVQPSISSESQSSICSGSQTSKVQSSVCSKPTPNAEYSADDSNASTQSNTSSSSTYKSPEKKRAKSKNPKKAKIRGKKRELVSRLKAELEMLRNLETELIALKSPEKERQKLESSMPQNKEQEVISILPKAQEQRHKIEEAKIKQPICGATSNDQLISEFKKLSYRECPERVLRIECFAWMILCVAVAVLFYYRSEKIFNSDCRHI